MEQFIKYNTSLNYPAVYEAEQASPYNGSNSTNYKIKKYSLYIKN